VHIANRDELETHHVDPSDDNERHLDPEYRVHDRTCLESSATGRLVEARPSRRKSTIAIVPPWPAPANPNRKTKHKRNREDMNHLDRSEGPWGLVNEYGP